MMAFGKRERRKMGQDDVEVVAQYPPWDWNMIRTKYPMMVYFDSSSCSGVGSYLTKYKTAVDSKRYVGRPG